MLAPGRTPPPTLYWMYSILWFPEQVPEGLTFDDVLLVPARSAVIPAEADTRTWLTRAHRLNIPIVSSAMDTVTESHLAIALAQQGGIGIIHRNMPIDRQAEEVDRVKRSESGMIVDPVTIGPEQKISDALEVMKRYRISGVPVTKDGKLVGILTNRDLRFETRFDLPISEVMTKENLITVPVGTTLEEAASDPAPAPRREAAGGRRALQPQGPDHGQGHPEEAEVPQRGQGRPGPAARGRGHRRHRRLSGARPGTGGAARWTCWRSTRRTATASACWMPSRRSRQALPDVDLMAGNVATYEGARDLIALGVDGIKVGIGPGSICTTRVVSRRRACRRSPRSRSAPAPRAKPACRSSPTAASSTRATSPRPSPRAPTRVMIGSLFAGTDESPGETILYQGRTFKSYRGMGSMGAMAQGSSRPLRAGPQRRSWCPKASKAACPTKGRWPTWSTSWSAACKSGMGYCGCAHDSGTCRRRRGSCAITAAGLRESHVHDVIITKEAPNYRLE